MHEMNFVFGFVLSRFYLPWNGEQRAFGGRRFKNVLAIIRKSYTQREHVQSKIGKLM